jgi:NAD(P)-dependent dehydrogenase (short-subunit alcohol dehydrogenase family)
VFFTYRSGKDRAEALVKTLTGCHVFALELDQSKPEALEAVLKRIPGTVDILINNAAVGTKTVEKIATERTEQDEAFFQVNALGPLWLTEKVLPAMRTNCFGKIIFVSSVDGGITHFPGARFADGMSKAALTQFAKHLAAELVDDPIDVFTICPGATDTPMFAASTLDKLSDKERTELLQSLPGKRLVQPKDIADLAVFLCSPSGQVLRGSILDASLGLGNNPFAIHQRRDRD